MAQAGDRASSSRYSLQRWDRLSEYARTSSGIASCMTAFLFFKEFFRIYGSALRGALGSAQFANFHSAPLLLGCYIFLILTFSKKKVRLCEHEKSPQDSALNICVYCWWLLLAGCWLAAGFAGRLCFGLAMSGYFWCCQRSSGPETKKGDVCGQKRGKKENRIRRGKG